MSPGGRIALALLWALSLVVTAAWTTTRAQESPSPILPVPGRIIAGEDLGFRLEGRRDGVPAGTLVVRINGTWVEVRSSLKVMPLK